MGVSSAAAPVIATVGVGGAAALAVTAAADSAIEATTGYSVIRDGILGGENEGAYEAFQVMEAMATGGVTQPATMSPGVCFVAGTPVMTDSGLRSIESITEGDIVWAEDPQTGEVACKQVSRTFINQSDCLIHLFVADEEIVTTPGHSFYVPSVGWVEAQNLVIGCFLQLKSGQVLPLVQMVEEILNEPCIVYNFEVDDFHTYFVGNAAILVHNSCRSTNKLRPDKNATGDHSTFRYDGQKQQITHYATYTVDKRNPSAFREYLRFDRYGKAHNGVPTPHVHTNNAVRPARLEEIPRK